MVKQLQWFVIKVTMRTMVPKQQGEICDGLIEGLEQFAFITIKNHANVQNQREISATKALVH